MYKTNAMDGLCKILVIIVLMNTGIKLYSQTIDEPYEVATWPGSAKAAISYTFDDGCSNQFAIAIPMFNEFGFCGTFFTVTDWSPNWPGLQKAASVGHEVASHTVSHPRMDTLDTEEEIAELANSAKIIYNHIKGMKGMTFAYPYCVRGRDSITSMYYYAARGCQGFIEGSTPSDFLNISSVICGNKGSVNSVSDFQQKTDEAVNLNGWCVYLLHGIDDDGGYSPLSSTVLHESLEYLDQNRSKFWVAPFGDVARYIKERNSVLVNALQESSDTIKLVVSDTLDNDTLYNHPVTIRRPLPTTWEWASGYQAGHEIQTSVIEDDSGKIIIFDVIPNKGEIILIKTDTPLVN